jgi:N-glycosylase/DNA lyase
MMHDACVPEPREGPSPPGATGRHEATALELRLRGPGGEPVDLQRTINSHGFAELAPARLDPATGSLDLTLRVRGAKPRRVRIGPGRRGYASVKVLGSRTPQKAGAQKAGIGYEGQVLAGASRVLRLDQDLSGFYALAAEDPDLSWATTGAGRMIRSPSVFEDVVKTVCTTNCSWSLTEKMVGSLVRELGDPATGGDGPLTNAFPTAGAMAAQPERFYREVVRAGYRSPYFVKLAKSAAAGDVDLESLAAEDDLPDDEIEARLLALPGVGPYAAAHVMMTLGRNSRLILDSWTRPTYARLLGKRTVPDAAIRRRFRRYGRHAGLAFWLFVTRDWIE